ncbi:unnamed protein product [Brassicogethes aeneus]|uniref:Uncharacterized protein n=1 Tax=Brassicogethes aeneus TaxID=1431903 RepID=A0A9P0FQ53_BRAAE|nr:unnamed protein product [Brassicogethes aeneus]
MERGIQRLFKERCPELMSENQFDVVEQRIYTRTGGTEKESRKKIIKAWHNGTEEDLQKEDSKESEGKSLTYALVLENAGKSYEDTLNEVKEAVGSNPASNLIRNIRSTREGKMVITLDKDKGAMEELQKALKHRTEMRVRAPGQKRKGMVFIRGIDGTTDKAEVEKAIKDRVESMGEKNWNLSELRPSFGYNQTATVSADRENVESNTTEESEMSDAPTSNNEIRQVEIKEEEPLIPYPKKPKVSCSQRLMKWKLLNRLTPKNTLY